DAAGLRDELQSHRDERQDARVRDQYPVAARTPSGRRNRQVRRVIERANMLAPARFGRRMNGSASLGLLKTGTLLLTLMLAACATQQPLDGEDYVWPEEA